MNSSSIHFDTSRSILQRTEFSLLPEIELFVKRDDLIHPMVSGNKWRKLKYHVAHFYTLKNANRIATFGGAYSNHLVAVACAGAVLNIPVSGIVRGDELHSQSNSVLQLCDLYGMEMHFVNRASYRKKEELAGELFGDNTYIIPEGGGGKRGVEGCVEIIGDAEKELDYFFTGVGSGTTLAGLAKAAYGLNLNVEGISALKNASYLKSEIEKLAGNNDFTFHTDYHGGGFAKLPDEYRTIGMQFIRETGILLDPVYTIKVVYAIVQLYNNGYFNHGDRVGLLHTGGLTGWFGKKAE